MTTVALLGLVALAMLLAFGFAGAPRDGRGARPMLSSYVVILLCFALYILLPASLILVSGSFTWATPYYSESAFSGAVWLSVLALAAFLYGNAVSRRRLPGAEPDGHTAQPTIAADEEGRMTNILLFVLLGIGLALKVALIMHTGGLSVSITRMSDYARGFGGVERLGAGAMLLHTASGVADGAATWGLMRAIKNRRQEKLWAVILIATMALTYVANGKRLLLILPIACVLVAIHVYRRPLTTRLVPAALALAVAFGFATLMVRVFWPASVQGYDVSLHDIAYAQGSVVQFYLYSLEFAAFEMISVAMVARPEIIDMFGGTWDAIYMTNVEPFLYSVPRFLWPGKPSQLYDLSYGISATLGATPFEAPTVGYASTIIGTSYLIAGAIGVIVVLLLLGFVTARIDIRIMSARWTGTSIVLYAIGLVVVFHLFRQGTLGWTFIVAIVQQYGTIAALLLLCLSAAAARPRLSRRPATARQGLVGAAGGARRSSGRGH